MHSNWRKNVSMFYMFFQSSMTAPKRTPKNQFEKAAHKFRNI